MLQNRKRVRHVRMLYKCCWCHRQMSKVTLQRTCCYCPPTDRCPSIMGIFKQIRLLPCFNRKLTQLFSEPYGFVPISRVWNPLGILPSHLMANRHNQRCWLPVDFRHQTTCLLYIFVIVSAFMRIAAGVHCLSVVLQ